MRHKIWTGIYFAFVCFILISVQGYAKSGDKQLVDYIGENPLVLSEDFGEPNGNYKSFPYSKSYENKGLEFPIADGYGPGTQTQAKCHQSHYPIIDELYGDSSLEEYLSYFKKNGYIEEPQVVAYSLGDNVIGFVDPDLYLLFRLESGGENEPPRSVTVSELYLPSYSESFQCFYVQTILHKLGYDPGPIDSMPGQKTGAAISAFQEDHWMENTGVLDWDFAYGLMHLWQKKCRYGSQEKWYSAYETQLVLWKGEGTICEDCSFALIYVDEDKIPELVFMGDSEAQGCYVVTWHDGQMSLLHTARLNYFYRHRKNIFSNSDGHMGYYYDFIYSIQDGNWVRIATGEYQDDEEASHLARLEDPEASMVYSFSWEGQEVDREEYARRLEEYLPDQETFRPSKIYDYMGILGTLWNGGPKEKDNGEKISVKHLYDEEERAGESPALGEGTPSERELRKRIVEAMPDTSKSIYLFQYDDFDRDGNYEAFAVVGDINWDTDLEIITYSGDLWYVDQDESYPLSTNIDFAEPDPIGQVIRCRDRSFVCYNQWFLTGRLSFLYTVDNGSPRKSQLSREGCIVSWDEEGESGELSKSEYTQMGHVYPRYPIRYDGMDLAYSGMTENEAQEPMSQVVDVSSVLTKTPLEAAQDLGFAFLEVQSSPYDKTSQIMVWHLKEGGETKLYYYGELENEPGELDIRIADEGYELYGARVGNTVSQATEELNAHGFYTREGTSGANKMLLLNENNSFISLEWVDGTITLWEYHYRQH